MLTHQVSASCPTGKKTKIIHYRVQNVTNISHQTVIHLATSKTKGNNFKTKSEHLITHKTLLFRLQWTSNEIKQCPINM